MTKYFLWSIVTSFIIFSNSFASPHAEVQLLASWGVELKDTGVIEYKNKKLIKLTPWLTNPLPTASLIDYSSIPMRLKPLVIYNN